MPRHNQTPKHTPFRRPVAPHTKQRFLNETDAQKVADLQMLQQPQLELRVYQCDQCNGWHLTSRTKNR